MLTPLDCREPKYKLVLGAIENGLPTAHTQNGQPPRQVLAALQLAAVPADALLHFLSDTRYKLFVNGVRVAMGPSRGRAYLCFL
ncbi:hypothetical protein BJ878DRAFT_519431 [Calycina marina]|uniref:Uncharacterized protein n=1 Tax=Calycina marina TaxID=1763456 RepID=A0A9P7YYW9_9HELO|nr:hypothetical protein BJ878DRAFT_519431 [Calycina marina]